MADDGSELTQDQTALLVHFQELTAIEDMTRCVQILEQHYWNIESAVQDTLNEREVSTRPAPELRLTQMNSSPLQNQGLPTNNPPNQPMGLFEYLCYIITLPFRFFYGSLTNIARGFFRFIWPEQRSVTDPAGDVMRFIQRYNQEYGQEHPTFYQGTYSQALSDAKRELKFLLVYLHQARQHEFCRNVLCNAELIEFVNTRMLFWACNVESQEGRRVSHTLHAYRYPFLSLLVQQDSNNMVAVLQIQEYRNHDVLINQITSTMTRNSGTLDRIRREREELSANRVLRTEQEAAYLESLRTDQEKERRKKEAEEQAERERQQEEDDQRRRDEVLRQLEKDKSEMGKLIPSEPALTDADVVTVTLKVPLGRVKRSFLKTQSLKYLYYFILCNDQCPDDFSVWTNYPKHEIPCKPTSEIPEPPTFEEVGICQSLLLHVYDNEA